MFCLDKMENRGDVTLKEIKECIESVKFDISKGACNPAHSWIKRIDLLLPNRNCLIIMRAKRRHLQI